METLLHLLIFNPPLYEIFSSWISPQFQTLELLNQDLWRKLNRSDTKDKKGSNRMKLQHHMTPVC